MRALRRLALALAVSLVACGLAAAADPVFLKLHQQEGDKAQYSLAISVQSKGAAHGKPPAGARIIAGSGQESVQATCGVEFAKALGIGRMQVIGRFLNGTVKATSRGQSETQDLAGLTVQYALTARGEMKNEQLLAGQPVTLPFSLLAVPPGVAFPFPLPDHAVKVGDTWSGAVDHVVATDTKQHTTFTSKVLGQTSYAGRDCLQIRTEAHGTVRAEAQSWGLANRVPATVKINTTETWLFDPAAGLLVKNDLKGSALTTVSLEGTGFSLTLNSTLDEHLRLTAWNGEKVTP